MIFKKRAQEHMAASLSAFVQVLCFVFLVAAPAMSADSSGKTINIALDSEPDSLNPVENTHEVSAYDINKIFSGLLKSDENLQMASDLAETWDVSSDGKVYTFHIKKGVKWQDGKDLTADDIKFTYDTVKDDKWISVFPAVSSDYKLIDQVTVVDPYTVKFTVQKAIVPFVENFALPILPKHILDGQDLSKTDFWQKPIGTGPFKFDSWTHGEELVLSANKDYFGGAPKFETLRYVFVPDVNARINLLKTGEVDAIQIDPQNMKTLEGVHGIKVYSVPSAQWYAMNMNNSKWPFSIKEIRQAIGYAIDKQKIVDTVFMGQGEPAYGPYSKASWVYNPEIEHPMDVAKAKQLLKEAGFSDTNGDGILEKDGTDLEFDILYRTNELIRRDIAIAVQTDLNSIGMKVNLVGKSPGEMTKVMMHENFLRAGGNPMDPDDYNYNEFNSAFINVGTSNLASYSNPQVDKLLEEGRTTFDKEKRKEIYQQLQTILAEDQPTAFIAFGNTLYAVSDKLTGIKPRSAPHEHGGITGELWWNVEQWNKQ
ncbi:MAG: ABC transporter substrate-binding protein [Methanotrichaceae archaeon]